MRSVLAVSILAATAACGFAAAQTGSPTPARRARQRSRRMGWMVGSPPPPDKLVASPTTAGLVSADALVVLAHRELMPTASSRAATGRSCTLPRAEREDIDAVTFQPIGGTSR